MSHGEYADGTDVAIYCAQCRIKGGARGAAAPGPAVLGAHNWREWLAGYRSVMGPAFGTAPGSALALMRP